MNPWMERLRSKSESNGINCFRLNFGFLWPFWLELELYWAPSPQLRWFTISFSIFLSFVLVFIVFMSVQSVELIPNVVWNAFVWAISMMNFDENWIIVKTNPERQLLRTVFRVKGTSSKFDKISKLSCSLTVSIRKTMKHENMPLKLVHAVRFQSGRTFFNWMRIENTMRFLFANKKIRNVWVCDETPKKSRIMLSSSKDGFGNLVLCHPKHRIYEPEMFFLYF